MNSLINVRMLELNETSDEPEVIDSKPVEPEVPVDNLSQDADKGTPNTKIEIKTQGIIDPTHSYSIDDFEKLEDKINRNYMDVNDAIIESFYQLNRDLMLGSSILEAISIDVIRQQKEILTESAIDSPKYKDDIAVLIESSGQNILQTIIDWIKEFLRKVKKFLQDIGINVSLSFVNYEKWATEKEETLSKKASDCGSQVDVSVYTWNKEELFKAVNFNEIHALAEKYVKSTTDKSGMKDIESDIASKYDNVTELKNDIYCHALAIAIGGNPGDDKFTDKEKANAAFLAKIKYNESTKYMNSDRTNKYLKELKNIKTNSNSCISSMRNSFINHDFDRLQKDAQRELKARDDNQDSRKYKYYRLRFDALSAIQEASNNIYRMKISLMKDYARELYNSLKALDSYESKVTDESVILNDTEIRGYTLHE